MEALERPKADYNPDDNYRDKLEPVGFVEAPKKEFKIVDNANYVLKSDVVYLYPFAELAVGQGVFIPVELNNTLEKLTAAIHRQVNQFRRENSQIEKNDNGDEVLENVTINAKVRHRDGTIKLDPDGNEKLVATSGLRPKLIGPSFAVKSVRADDKIGENTKAEADGVLVIRLA